jgi:Survival motor neuron (SMN) interacting protein 1 (SIP1)
VRAVLRNLAHVDDNHEEEEFPPPTPSTTTTTWRGRQSSLRLLLTQSRTSWMYALLACLEKPLHRQEAACLYQLVKRLCLLRASMTLSPPPPPLTSSTTATMQQEYDQQRQELARCNVLITIIAMYFEQGGERVMQVTKHT